VVTAFRISPEGRLDHNLGSVAAIEKDRRSPVQFRALSRQFYVSGWPAWHEFELLDQTLAIGEVRLKVVKRIVRCAAINVDPGPPSATYIPPALMRHLGPQRMRPSMPK